MNGAFVIYNRSPSVTGPKVKPSRLSAKLAVDLQVCVIAVKRLLEIEREGVIVTHQGKGSQVASNPGLGTRMREQEREQHLEPSVRIGTQIGLQPKDLQHRLRATYERLAELRRNSHNRSGDRS
jgi:DNA-binding transcriptional regulator YhcF (GntR family)